MNKNRIDQAQALGLRLLENAGRVKYGSAGLELRIHAGRIVDIFDSTHENNRRKWTEEEVLDVNGQV